MECILIIDNDLSFVRLIQALFQKEHKVLTTSDGRKGLEILKREQVDVCILDNNRHVNKGDEILLEIRKIEPNLPTIFVTDHPSLELKKKLEGEIYSVDYFLTKPVNLRFIQELIIECCNQKLKNSSQKIVKFERKNNDVKENVKHNIPKKKRLIEIVELLSKNPGKWNQSMLSIRFRCTRMSVCNDFKELKEMGFEVKKKGNGYFIHESKMCKKRYIK